MNLLRKKYLFKKNAHKRSFLFTFVLAEVFGNSQNLVLNGSFENYKNCPEKISNLSIDVLNMSTPTTGTTDYFNSCGLKKMGAPENFKGEQKVLHGSGYVGLYMYAPNDYREYIQLELSSTLIREERYQITLHLSLAETSGKAIYDDVMVAFTNEKITSDVNKNLSRHRLERITNKPFGFVKLTSKTNLVNHEKWITIQAEFEAKGFENYLLIGNFKNNKASKIVDVHIGSRRYDPLAYYYLDDVQIVHIESPNFKLDEIYVLDHVKFEFDNFKLTREGKKNIRRVYNYLIKQKGVKLVLNGHTDNKGTTEYNQYLSSRRARTVAKFFEELGFPKERIEWKGFGDRFPLVNKADEQSRKQNRRVEFVITEFDDN